MSCLCFKARIVMLIVVLRPCRVAKDRSPIGQSVVKYKDHIIMLQSDDPAIHKYLYIGAMARKNDGRRHRRCTALLSSSRRGVETIRRLFASSLPDAAHESLSTRTALQRTRSRAAADTTHRCYARASSLAHLAAPSPPTSIGSRRRSFTAAAAATVQSIPPLVVSSSTPSSLYGMGPGARARTLSRACAR